jgi:putative FmdB family regulatory protein
MPLYEYECTGCGKHTEKIQKFSDPEITVCPHCGGVLRRVITAPAIAFKGGGWYADGYGNAKPSGGESKPEAGTKPEGGASAGSAESKPAAVASDGGATPAAAPSAPAAAAKP